jgi:hypothetical protein
MINGKKKKKKNEAPEGNQYYVGKKFSRIFIPVLRFDRLFVCVMHIFSGMALL